MEAIYYNGHWYSVEHLYGSEALDTELAAAAVRVSLAGGVPSVKVLNNGMKVMAA